MNVKNFCTVRYFAEVYFNCSMNWSDLEILIDDFLMRENKQTIEAFRNEIKILYMYALENQMLLKDIAGILTGRATHNQETEHVIKLFYDKSVPKIKFRSICYFLNCHFGCYIGLFHLESRIEDFLMWENIKILEKKINTIYKSNDHEFMWEVKRLENCIEAFFEMGNTERIEGFIKEIESVYILIGNHEFMKEVVHRLGGDIRVPVKKSVCMIKLLYDNCIKEES